MARRFTSFLVAAAALALPGSAAVTAVTADAAPARSQAQARQAWSAFVASYIEQEFRANPAFAVGQGRHEYDGQLPDWSETGLQTEMSRLRCAIAAAQAFDPRRLTRDRRGSSATI